METKKKAAASDANTRSGKGNKLVDSIARPSEKVNPREPGDWRKQEIEQEARKDARNGEQLRLGLLAHRPAECTMFDGTVITYPQILAIVYRVDPDGPGIRATVQLRDKCGHSFSSARPKSVRVLWDETPPKGDPAWKDSETAKQIAKLSVAMLKPSTVIYREKPFSFRESGRSKRHRKRRAGNLCCHVPQVEYRRISALIFRSPAIGELAIDAAIVKDTEADAITVPAMELEITDRRLNR